MKKLAGIDLLRVIASAGVVMIHVVTSPVKNAVNFVEPSTIWILNIAHLMLLWTVPVFFMVSGYCLLLKENLSYKYCLQKVGKFAGILFSVGLCYAMMEIVYEYQTFSFKMFFQALLRVCNGQLWDHMWYIYAIIGVYLVMPVLHYFFKRSGEGRTLVVILFMFTILLPYVNKITWFDISVYFPFGEYLFYTCFGAYCATIEIKKKQIRLLGWGLFAVSNIALCCIGEKAGYLDLFVCLSTIGIFLAIGTADINGNKVLRTIAECSLGVYIFHPLFLNIIIKVLKVDFLHGYFTVNLIATAVVIYAISFAMTYCLKKMPVVGKLF